ncbi:MAG: hypothetical protein IPM49_03210 [Flavobacteriales bacterium]|nr:hypothetical protein [Flavobacteriales bacterium]
MPPSRARSTPSVTDRYVELYERITGQAFHPAPTEDINARVQQAVEGYLERV